MRAMNDREPQKELRPEKVQQRLASLQEESGLSKEKVAQGIGITVRHWSRLTKGGSVPGPDTLAKIAAYFDVPIDEFFDERVGGSDLRREINELRERLDVLTAAVAHTSQELAELRAAGPRATRRKAGG